MFLSAKVANIIQINITYTRHFLGKKKLFSHQFGTCFLYISNFFLFPVQSFPYIYTKKLNLNPHEK